MKKHRITGLTVYLTKNQMDDALENIWLTEFLRYAGLVSRPEYHGGYGAYVGFLKMYAPRDVDKEVWADHNRQRMQSFGYYCEVI